MPIVIHEKDINGKDHPLFILNLGIQPEGRALSKAYNRLEKVFVGLSGNDTSYKVVILSEDPKDSNQKYVKDLMKESKVLEQVVNNTDESRKLEIIQEFYRNGVVINPNQNGVFYGDNTKPLPLSDDSYSLVVGRRVVCFCGITSNACGVPDNMGDFIKEIIRVLRPGGKAFIHGDEGSQRHASALTGWKKAVHSIAASYDERIHIHLLKYNGKFVGIKISKYDDQKNPNPKKEKHKNTRIVITPDLNS